MKTPHKLYLLAIALVSFTFASCTSEDPEPENDGEVITDVTLTFQELDDSNNPVGDAMEFTASDSEGIEIGGTPEIETVMLTAGKTYQMSVEVFNSIAGEDITEEISEEADEHQFYFLGSAFVGTPVLTYQYDDEGGINLGLNGIVSVVADPSTNNATMQVLLRHDLDKNYPGADNPNFTDYAQAGGESDLDITFPVIIE
ncbi:hypothetical protein PBT90_10185 [Algoriphagus halophytocola]|uniref:Type 1 periplasmic binding fold superfamily protein n=1 Tax=Algoriphagus halophytocola TaxID=2991499 RepID=A0ABY6MN48_9BACT|nr:MULTISPECIES: hypothetical protein [unclassified Algoriphagus]UZD23756.1 hypothetical protein OM944_04515 [Algoriphagus sp. TR-M5]WBL45050.1 hypothetical protein PBT90_10185 [Algoriphagus sp. TR-M9]